MVPPAFKITINYCFISFVKMILSKTHLKLLSLYLCLTETSQITEYFLQYEIEILQFIYIKDNNIVRTT